MSERRAEQAELISELLLLDGGMRFFGTHRGMDYTEFFVDFAVRALASGVGLRSIVRLASYCGEDNLCHLEIVGCVDAVSKELGLVPLSRRSRVALRLFEVIGSFDFQTKSQDVHALYGFLSRTFNECVEGQEFSFAVWFVDLYYRWETICCKSVHAYEDVFAAIRGFVGASSILVIAGVDGVHVEASCPDFDWMDRYLLNE